MGLIDIRGTYRWPGDSGEKYGFRILPLKSIFNIRNHIPDSEGVYIFSRLEGNVHRAVYIGQGDLRPRYDAALAEGCVTAKSATHYFFATSNLEFDREEEERDLIAGNPECLVENGGCNGVEWDS